ncbi:MAG: helix-turn-helix transcriptional regulator, partial [Opitutaceae bacterium]
LLEEQRPEPGPKDLIPLGLTPREAEVLFWISQGKTNPEIALIIGAARRTVATHVEHLLAKLEVENRACAALMAVDRLRPAIGA